MSQQGSNRGLIVLVVVLVVALIGAICVGAGLLIIFLNQGNTGTAPVAQATAVPGTTSVAPTRAPSSSGTTSANSLRLPGSGDPPTLDPALTSDAESAVYVVELFSGLVTLDQNLKVVPDLAEKWEVSDDRKTYTFTFRKDAKFHDGRPVTAQDFKYSVERAANPATTSPTADTYLGDIVGVKDKLNRKASAVSGVVVVDDYTLKITIDSPKTYFIAKLTFPTAFVVDKNNVERGGRTWTDKPNGTGPFKLKEYVRGQRIILARNENYYLDPKPKIDEIEFILGGGSFMTMYENGDLDATYVGRTDIERVTDPTSPLNKELFVGPELSTFFIVFNNRKPPFDDIKVRQAFAMAIDRQKIVDVVYRKIPILAETILPPGMPGYSDPVNKIKYDPAQAKQLLAQSKYAGKLPEITWFTVGGGGATAENIQAMTAMLKENLNVNISIQQTDWATFLGQLHDPANIQYQLFDTGWIADYADPQNFLEILFKTGSNENWGGYSNKQVDSLLEQAGLEKDSAARFKLYQQAEQQILSDVPVVPMIFSRQYVLTKPYVKGAIYPPLIIPRLKYMSLSR
ncbi:MAG: peptide ABC transporter substrate-binding protein [Chloroflexi bacterium]|nr:peptide ABC transporter substrate-binding protein [Chloroflexota bacterium]